MVFNSFKDGECFSLVEFVSIVRKMLGFFDIELFVLL